MKKLILVIGFIFLLFSNGKSQMIVEDPNLTAIIAPTLEAQAEMQTEELAQSAQTVVNTAQTLTLLQKAQKALETVNSYLQGAKFVTDIYSSQRNLIETANKKISYYRKCKAFKNSDLRIIQKQIENIIIMTTSNFQSLKAVMSPNMKMNDYERMKIIMDNQRKQQEYTQSLDMLYYQLDKAVVQSASISAIEGLRFKK